MNLQRSLDSGRRVCSMGFDDAHSPEGPGAAVALSGIFCIATRFEGMVCGSITKDGFDGTKTIVDMFCGSKYRPQIHMILIDGITLGGMNTVNLQQISDLCGVPAVASMRRRPDMEAFRHAMQQVPGFVERWASVEAAGPVHEIGDFVFQVQGEAPKTIARALRRLTDRGLVPEPLRIAHLIGTAVAIGESRGRA